MCLLCGAGPWSGVMVLLAAGGMGSGELSMGSIAAACPVAPVCIPLLPEHPGPLAAARAGGAGRIGCRAPAGGWWLGGVQRLRNDASAPPLGVGAQGRVPQHRKALRDSIGRGAAPSSPYLLVYNCVGMCVAAWLRSDRSGDERVADSNAVVNMCLCLGPIASVYVLWWGRPCSAVREPPQSCICLVSRLSCFGILVTWRVPPSWHALHSPKLLF